MSAHPAWLVLLLFSWQSLAAVWDFCDRRIPLGFSLFPLLSGLVHFGIFHSPLGAVLLLGSILATNLPGLSGDLLAVLPPLALGFFALPRFPLALCLGWLILWGLWRGKILGGADALAGTVLLVWYPRPEMLLAILLGLALWSLGLLVIRNGWWTPLRIWVVLKSGWPKYREGAGRQPGLGAFPLALVIYCLWLCTR